MLIFVLKKKYLYRIKEIICYIYEEFRKTIWFSDCSMCFLLSTVLATLLIMNTGDK